MKRILAVMLLLSTASAFAQVHVRGYTKKDGTYVAPHERTAPNHTNLDNYSTRGNVNPYTGKEGTKEPDYGYQTPRPVVGVQPIQPLQAPQPPQPPQPPQVPSLGRGF
jgi:hypothetical protein